MQFIEFFFYFYFVVHLETSFLAKHADHVNKDCIVLYCIVLYCIVLYCIVLYCIVLYRV